MFEYLRVMDNEIQRTQEWIETLRSKAMSMTKSYSNDRVQTSSGDSLGDIMCKIVTLEEKLNDMVDDYADRKAEAKKMIFRLHTQEWQDVVYMHDIEFMTFREIARIKGSTTKAVNQKYRRATKYMKNHLT